MESVFERMAHACVQAVSLGPGGVIFQGRAILQKLALSHGMPMCGWSREPLVSGLLLSYGPEVGMSQHLPVLVDKILARRPPCRSSS
jgi:hypothetical protein